MKRRTRPLEPEEFRSIDIKQQLEVDLLLDEEDYALKWPESPLGKILRATKTPKANSPPRRSRKSSASQPERRAFFDASILGISRGTRCKDPFLSYTLSREWHEQLKETGNWTASGTARLTLEETEFAEDAIEMFEIRASKAQHELSSAMLKLTLLSKVATLRDDECSDSRLRDVHRIWLAMREASASIDHPWGAPLIAALFETSANDEYFINCSIRETFSRPSVGAIGEAGDDKASSGRGVTTRAQARQAAAVAQSSRPNPACLPFEIPVELYSLCIRKDVPPHELAAAFPPLESVKLKPLKERQAFWAIDDLDGEVLKVNQWYDEVVAGAAIDET